MHFCSFQAAFVATAICAACPAAANAQAVIISTVPEETVWVADGVTEYRMDITYLHPVNPV